MCDSVLEEYDASIFRAKDLSYAEYGYKIFLRKVGNQPTYYNTVA